MSQSKSSTANRSAKLPLTIVDIDAFSDGDSDHSTGNVGISAVILASRAPCSQVLEWSRQNLEIFSRVKLETSVASDMSSWISECKTVLRKVTTKQQTNAFPIIPPPFSVRKRVSLQYRVRPFLKSSISSRFPFRQASRIRVVAKLKSKESPCFQDPFGWSPDQVDVTRVFEAGQGPMTSTPILDHSHDKQLLRKPKSNDSVFFQDRTRLSDVQADLTAISGPILPDELMTSVSSVFDQSTRQSLHQANVSGNPASSTQRGISVVSQMAEAITQNQRSPSFVAVVEEPLGSTPTTPSGSSNFESIVLSDLAIEKAAEVVRQSAAKILAPEKMLTVPKRNLNAYFLFIADERAKAKTSDTGLRLRLSGKELGGRWASANSETKAKFEQLAKKDKERYKKEMEAYKGGAGSSQKVAEGPTAQIGKKSLVKNSSKAHVKDELDEQSDSQPGEFDLKEKKI